MDNVEKWRSMWEKEQTHNEYLSARIREMEDEIEDAKATAHERGYYQGKAAGDAFGAAMREHVTQLEAENKALQEALTAFLKYAEGVPINRQEADTMVVNAHAALAETENQHELD